MTIAIVDYQMGNLRSVQKAFERIGRPAIVTADPDRIAEAERIVLPGVGACGDALRELRERKLVQPIRDAIQQDRPFLGICLGLQMLFDVSYENGEHRGLGVVAGDVVRFQVPREYKVPHMGWNQIRRRRESPLLEGIPDGAYFYFVHSYYVRPVDPEATVLEADYPEPFCAMVGRGRMFATQFHPEKSQRQGQELLKNFTNL